jgi:hypothetical protein
VDGRVEGEAEARLVHAEKMLDKEQEPGTGDGKKLRKTLHYAQEGGLKEF